jgi:hypothetical protein
MKSEKIIDLTKYVPDQDTALVGRKNGEQLLRKFKEDKILLKDLEKEFDLIKIHVPRNIITINKSFFLGWLETRILELGKEQFNIKYSFETEEDMKSKLTSHIEAAFLTSTQDEILTNSAP